jgi:ATP-dependent Clp protease ATP-binding subunit ClpC
MDRSVHIDPPALGELQRLAGKHAVKAMRKVHDSRDMFERFTDRARRVVVFAQEEARMLAHNYIGTEHLLLGLIHDHEGVAAEALRSMDISLETVRHQVESIIGRGQEPAAGHIPFTPRAKRVLELSLREALQLGHDYIGTEHILLGLVREGEGVAAQVLQKLGADLGRVRHQVIQLLSGFPGSGSGEDARPIGDQPSVSELRSRVERVLHRLDALEAQFRDLRPELVVIRDLLAGSKGGRPDTLGSVPDPPAETASPDEGSGEQPAG